MNVRTWLAGLELAEFADAFAENGVDQAMLYGLSNEDLKDLGVARLRDRKNLLQAIAELAAPDGAGPETAAEKLVRRVQGAGERARRPPVARGSGGIFR